MGIRTFIVGAVLASGCVVGSGGGGGDESGGGGGGGSTGEGSGSGSGSGSGVAMKLPPTNARFDYQLGGPYTPPGDVQIVSRDRNATPAAGAYNICYVNGFQIQPDEESTWLSEHPDLILRDANGNPVIDADWDEMLIDISTPAKRTAVAAVVGAWIEGCSFCVSIHTPPTRRNTYAEPDQVPRSSSRSAPTRSVSPSSARLTAK